MLTIEFCKLHILCFDCPFKLGLRGHYKNKGICQYGKKRVVRNGYNKLKNINKKRY
jgi:hypothetical protein